MGEALAAHQGLTTLDLSCECLRVLGRSWTGCAYVYAAAVLVLGRRGGGTCLRVSVGGRVWVGVDVGGCMRGQVGMRLCVHRRRVVGRVSM